MPIDPRFSPLVVKRRVFRKVLAVLSAVEGSPPPPPEELAEARQIAHSLFILFRHMSRYVSGQAVRDQTILMAITEMMRYGREFLDPLAEGNMIRPEEARKVRRDSLQSVSEDLKWWALANTVRPRSLNGPTVELLLALDMAYSESPVPH